MLKFRLIKLKRISNQTKVQIVFNLCKSEITDIIAVRRKFFKTVVIN